MPIKTPTNPSSTSCLWWPHFCLVLWQCEGTPLRSCRLEDNRYEHLSPSGLKSLCCFLALSASTTALLDSCIPIYFISMAITHSYSTSPSVLSESRPPSSQLVSWHWQLFNLELEHIVLFSHRFNVAIHRLSQGIFCDLATWVELDLRGNGNCSCIFINWIFFLQEITNCIKLMSDEMKKTREKVSFTMRSLAKSLTKLDIACRRVARQAAEGSHG